MGGRFPSRNIDGVTTVSEIPANNAVIRVSDGTDDYEDGDVILVAEWDGTPVAARLGNLSDAEDSADDSDGSLLDVDLNVTGSLGGLL